jgi:aryl-phospho-beta-D-glucosidase BglC (GH1 family)
LGLLCATVIASGLFALAGCTGASAPSARAADAPDQLERDPQPDFGKLHGFNLLGKFGLEWSNKGYTEEDFVTIRELGFNFARLPIDYRTYVKRGTLLEFDEGALGEIDDAVAFGKRHGVHVCLNLHRGPGYTVASPPEPKSLWKDAEMQQAFQAHWEMLARRYQAEPAAAVSFNLLNEPAGVGDDEFGGVMRPVIEAIRRISPSRPILSDGLEYCQKPARSLEGLDVVQSARGYHPFTLTHYKASWVNGSDRWPEPVWPPQPRALPDRFFGEGKLEYRSALEIVHPFRANDRVLLTVHQVSHFMQLSARASDRVIWQKEFSPGPGAGEWNEVVFSNEWNIHQNIYDKTYEIVVPSATDSLTIEPGAGDWLTIAKLAIRSSGKDYEFLPDNHEFGAKFGRVSIGADGKLVALDAKAPNGRELLRESLRPWLDYRAGGGRTFVGELGAWKHTPHETVLAWLDDLLSIYQAEGLGWALWELRGDFGVLESGRTDVEYGKYGSHDVDDRMLALLQKYR